MELAEYLHRHSRHRVEQTLATLDCFDGVHVAQRATAPALSSVGLMDPVCPPSTRLMRPGCTSHRAAEVADCRAEEHRLALCAPVQHVRGRADPLNSSLPVIPFAADDQRSVSARTEPVLDRPLTP